MHIVMFSSRILNAIDLYWTREVVGENIAVREKSESFGGFLFEFYDSSTALYYLV